MKRLLVAALTAALLGTAADSNAQGSLSMPPFKKVKLKNGLTLLLSEQHEAPIISFNFIVRAGSVDDPAGKEGVAGITAGLLRKGTSTRSADQISADLDFIGGELDAGARNPPGCGHAYIDVRDVDALFEELRPSLEALPAGRWGPPKDMFYGQREFWVRDPDGNLINFGQGIGGNAGQWDYRDASS